MRGVIFTRVSDAHSLDLRVERENKFIMKKLINKSCESNIKIVGGEQVSSENIYTYFDIFLRRCILSTFSQQTVKQIIIQVMSSCFTKSV